MPLRAFAKLFPNRLTKTGMPTGLRKCNTKLRAYNGTNIPQLGALETTITWKDEETKEVNKMDTTFYIADTPGPAILGLPSCSRLRIVNLNCSVQLRKHGQPVKVSKEREKVKQDMKNLKPINSKDDLIKAYPDRFEGIGKFPGTYHIYLKEDAIPVVHTPRKCPIAIRPLVDKKLDKLLEQDIIVPVTEPTDWVSSLAYSWKADGDLRTCLNPTHLNKAIRRDHYRTPTLEEITHELAGSTKFTKVDGSSSYYCIVLDYESSLLTTFNTHRGRFRFVCLPFGLACAQDIFQRMMDQILDRCEGVIGIADDIIIHGKDDAEHDRRLHKFMEVAREHGLVLNKKKCEVKSNSVKFFGCVYDKHGAHPDPSKVSAIKEMPAPQNKGELQSFLGMVTYLSPSTSINKDIEQLVEACATCQRHRPQEPRQPLKPTPPPERPWQHLGADFMMFDGSEYLVIVDYYSKMPIVRKMPTSQCNSAKTITVLKELFAEHGIPEEIRSDNGPQFASHLFAEFTKDWNIKQSTSSPRNPRSNGQAESAVKIVKGLLTHAKCSGQDPYLALLAYRSTPVDSHLRSPAEMLYQRALRTTVPQRIRHKDPYAALVFGKVRGTCNPECS